MYQSVLRDPGGDSLVRIISDITNGNRAVVNGSLLIVPSGTKAFVVINGIISPPYPPGRYELFTGTDPFFVRLRNIMTRGDPGTSLSVFFISEHKYSMLTGGTGETMFREKRFDLTLHFLAAYNLTYCINDAGLFLRHYVGTYSEAFSEEGSEQFIRQTALMPIRDTLSNSLSNLRSSDFNSQLTTLSDRVTPLIARPLSEYGIGIRYVNVTGINIPPSDITRLNQLENEYAQQKLRTDIEKDNLERIWQGSTNNRSIAEAMTGITSAGRIPPSVNNETSQSSGMISDMMKFMLMMQMMPQVKDMMNGMMSSQTSSSIPPQQSPPPLPGIICPSCHKRWPRGTKRCPECGHSFN